MDLENIMLGEITQRKTNTIKEKWKSLSVVQLFVTPWTIQSMEWVAVPCYAQSLSPQNWENKTSTWRGFISSSSEGSRHIQRSGVEQGAPSPDLQQYL